MTNHTLLYALWLMDNALASPSFMATDDIVALVEARGILAFLLHKDLVVVRKDSDYDNHSIRNVEGPANHHPMDGPLRCVIVDDFTSSGDTLRHIEKNLEGKGGQVVGVCYYRPPQYHIRTPHTREEIREKLLADIDKQYPPLGNLIGE